MGDITLKIIMRELIKKSPELRKVKNTINLLKNPANGGIPAKGDIVKAIKLPSNKLFFEKMRKSFKWLTYLFLSKRDTNNIEEKFKAIMI